MMHDYNFKNLVKDKFGIVAKKNYLPNQAYINRLIASLFQVEPNSYNQSHIGFISEYNYIKATGLLLSIKDFVDGCLNQLFWINFVLESGMFAGTIEDLEEEFNYITPTLLGDPWTLNKVTKKGVIFRGTDPHQDFTVIINKENILMIATALSTVEQQYGEHITAKKNKHVKSVVISDTNYSSLFISKELETNCLNVLKEIRNPVLDVNGQFIDKHGMKGAIVIWYDHCKILGFISESIKNRREIIAMEVMKIIPRLSIDGSTFDKSPEANKYKEDIIQKLSQLSRE